MKTKRVAARAPQAPRPVLDHRQVDQRHEALREAAEAVLKRFPCVYPKAGFGSVVDVTDMEPCGECEYCLLRAALALPGENES